MECKLGVKEAKDTDEGAMDIGGKAKWVRHEGSDDNLFLMLPSAMLVSGTGNAIVQVFGR